MAVKFAVCALIFNEQDQLLAVSRKDNHNDFGLPGGKVEDNETIVQALIREVKEETGLDIVSHMFIFGNLNDKKSRYVMTYSCIVKDFNTHTNEAGVLKWTDWNEIEIGTFGAYNRHVHYTLDRMVADMDIDNQFTTIGNHGGSSER